MLLQVVLDTMKMHANHTEVVRNACWVLMNMSANAANRVAIIAQGGVAAFRQAKKNHPGNGEIQMITDVMLCNGVDEDVLCIWAESYYAYGRIRIMHMGFNYIMMLLTDVMLAVLHVHMG
jgi:hypothetical protein